MEYIFFSIMAWLLCHFLWYTRHLGRFNMNKVCVIWMIFMVRSLSSQHMHGGLHCSLTGEFFVHLMETLNLIVELTLQYWKIIVELEQKNLT